MANWYVGVELATASRGNKLFTTFRGVCTTWHIGSRTATNRRKILTQEVFVRVYRSLEQYDPKAGDLANWLMRLARNLVIDDYRKRVRTPTDVGEDLTDHEFHLHSHTDTPDRRVERQERAGQVHQAIAKLPPDLRECVILRDIEELSYQEIVDILQIPLGTVKSRINRGRIELAKTLRRMKVVEYI